MDDIKSNDVKEVAQNSDVVSGTAAKSVSADNSNNEGNGEVVNVETNEVATEEVTNEGTKEDEDATNVKSQDDVIKELQKQLEDANSKINEMNSALSTIEDLKSQSKINDDKVAKYESTLGDILNAKMQNVPDGVAALMPETYTVVEKLQWLEKAEKHGLINTKQQQGDALDVEIGRPIGNYAQPKVDAAKMSAMDLMRAAYSSFKNN